MGITNIYLKINKVFETIEKVFAVTIITAIVIIVFVSTVARYVFDSPIFGADRLATYLMIWLGFLGFQIAVSKFRHIEIEAIKSKVRPSIKYIMNILTSIIASIFLYIFFQLSYEFLNESIKLADTDIVLEIPIWWIILIIPISFLISSIRYLFAGLLWWDIYKGNRKEEDIVQKGLL